MRLMKSTFTDVIGPIGRPIAPGAEVDFDEVVSPGLTLEQALGEHAAGFASVDEDKPKRVARRADRDQSADAPKE